jgi:hypothetical protein
MKAKYAKDQRTVTFLMLFNPVEKKKAMRAAHEAGISLGEYARRAIAFAVANPHIVKV